MVIKLRYYTVKGVCELYGISDPGIVGGWIHRGELRAIDISSRPGSGRPTWRIPAEAIEAFEAARTSRPPEPRVRQQRQRKTAVAAPRKWII